MKIISEVNEGLNLYPSYYAYQGTWAKLNKCEDCEMIGLYEDMHEVNPCPNCGGKVKRGGAGRWTGSWTENWFGVGSWGEGQWELRKGVEK